jgi:hypothetical protein
MAEDEVMAEPIARIASRTLSANTSLTTATPESRCRWRADRSGCDAPPERRA